MKVLIVNGYAQETPETKRQFECFVEATIDVNCYLPSQAFAKYKYLCVGTPEFIVRNKSDVDEYLYEPSSRWSTTESAKVKSK